jgi:hypothetical protein
VMRLRCWRTRTTDFKRLWTIWRPQPASTGCPDGSYPSAAAMATPHAALRITRYMTSIEVPTGWLILPRARSSKPSYACQSSIASHTSMVPLPPQSAAG